MGNILNAARPDPVKVEMASKFVKEAIAKDKVVIFSKTYCPYCTMAKEVCHLIFIQQKQNVWNTIYNSNEKKNENYLWRIKQDMIKDINFKVKNINAFMIFFWFPAIPKVEGRIHNIWTWQTWWWWWNSSCPWRSHRRNNGMHGYQLIENAFDLLMFSFQFRCLACLSMENLLAAELMWKNWTKPVNWSNFYKHNTYTSMECTCLNN